MLIYIVIDKIGGLRPPSQPRPEKRSDSLILYIDWQVPGPASTHRVCIALTEMGKDFFSALVLHVFLSR